MMSKPRLDIAILHPTLGLGGAERLILQVAVALADAGHSVTVYVNAYNPDQAFPEARAENLTIRRSFGWLPAHIGGRFRILCAWTRMTCLVLGLAFKKKRIDLFITDLIPHVVPLLRRLFTDAAQVIYCHYPDQLLTPPQRGWYRWYRRPWNRLEVRGYAQADLIMTNSLYTRGMLERLVDSRRMPPVKVVHPGVAVPVVGKSEARETRRVVLCLGRFHPSKNQRLALEAFALVMDGLASPHEASYRLVFAGGYDKEHKEGQATFKMLEAAIREKRLEAQVSLYPNVSEEALQDLWKQSLVLVFPPVEEHFGIVPLEAMAQGIPVIAADRGGPTETIRDGLTGFLRPPTAADFAAALTRLLKEPDLQQKMGAAARQHVEAHFALGTFSATVATRIDEVFAKGMTLPRRPSLLVAQPVMAYGGGHGLAAWVLEALAPLYDITVACVEPPNYAEMNRLFGTSLTPTAFTHRVMPAWITSFLKRVSALFSKEATLAFLHLSLFQRYVQHCARRGSFDGYISTCNEFSFPGQGIQYIHFPKYYEQRPPQEYKGLHSRTRLLKGYRRFSDWIGGTDLASVRRNVAVANARYIATLYESCHAKPAQVVHPPVGGTFQHLPWSEKKDTVVCLGRLAPEKELEKCIAIVGRLRRRGHGLKLVLIGTWDCSEAYRSKIQALVEANPWIELRTNLSRTALVTCLQESRYGLHGMVGEHFGMAVAEMQEAGCIVFVPGFGGPVEIVDHEPAQLYADEDDAVEKMVTVLEKDRLQQALLQKVWSRRGQYASERFMQQIRHVVSCYLRDRETAGD